MSGLRARLEKLARRWLRRMVPAGVVWWTGVQTVLEALTRAGAA